MNEALNEVTQYRDSDIRGGPVLDCPAQVLHLTTTWVFLQLRDSITGLNEVQFMVTGFIQEVA